MIATVELKYNITGTRFFAISNGKLRYREESGLIFLFIVNENSKIGLHGAVPSFCLVISLGIKLSRVPLLDFQEKI